MLQQGENQGRRTGNHRSQRQIPPSLEASASQNFNFGRGLTAQNTYADRNTSQFGWNAGMSLPLFGGLAEYRNLKVSKLVLKQYIYETEATKDNIALNVISQYLRVLYCKGGSKRTFAGGTVGF